MVSSRPTWMLGRELSPLQGQTVLRTAELLSSRSDIFLTTKYVSTHLNLAEKTKKPSPFPHILLHMSERTPNTLECEK